MKLGNQMKAACLAGACALGAAAPQDANAGDAVMISTGAMASSNAHPLDSVAHKSVIVSPGDQNIARLRSADLSDSQAKFLKACAAGSGCYMTIHGDLVCSVPGGTRMVQRKRWTAWSSLLKPNGLTRYSLAPRASAF